MRRSALQDQAFRVKGQFFLDGGAQRLQKITERELYRSKGNRVGACSQSNAARQRRLGRVQFEAHVSCDGYVDSDAVRLAVARGSSARLGQRRVLFLAQLPISLHMVDMTGPRFFQRRDIAKSAVWIVATMQCLARTTNCVSSCSFATPRGGVAKLQLLDHSWLANEFGGGLRTTGSVILEVFLPVVCEGGVRRTGHNRTRSIGRHESHVLLTQQMCIQIVQAVSHPTVLSHPLRTHPHWLKSERKRVDPSTLHICLLSL